MEKPYLGMLGYTAEGRPFLREKNVDVDEAKHIAQANDLSEYILVPRWVGGKPTDYDHHGYIRDEAGEYKPRTTRLAVFRHLLTAGKGEVPSREDVGLE
jgi:hypothetical protein